MGDSMTRRAATVTATWQVDTATHSSRQTKNRHRCLDLFQRRMIRENDAENTRIRCGAWERMGGAIWPRVSGSLGTGSMIEAAQGQDLPSLDGLTLQACNSTPVSPDGLRKHLST